MFSSQRILSLVLIGTRVWLTLRLSASKALELGACPEARRRQPQRQPFERDSKAGKHQHTAQLVLAPTPVLVAPASHIFGKANIFRGFPLIDERRRVLKDKNQLLTGRGSPRRRPKMSGQIRRSLTDAFERNR